MKLRSTAGLAAGLFLAAAAPAAAAPVTVDLRIEGPTRTLFEGPVTTDVRPFRFSGDPQAHQCDGTAANGGPSAVPVPTRGAALAEAAERTPFSIAGSWHPQFGASFTNIAGEGVAFDPGTNRFLGEYENGAFAQLGACADDIQPGDDVLFAYGDGSEILLALTGPARARPGERVVVRVTNRATGAAVAGADVGGVVTGADGSASVGPFAARGEHELKASRAGAIRSNRLRVCVTDGADGACGTTLPVGTPPVVVAPDTVGPVARIAGIREQQRFRRRRGPRTLRGVVEADPSGLRAVKLRLTRQVGRRCWYYSGSRERFLARRCGTRRAFRVGNQERWSYLLPWRLGPGRYVLDVLTLDRRGNRNTLARGSSRIVFYVGAVGARGAVAALRGVSSSGGRARRVEVMVVGRERVLRSARSVRLRPRSVAVGRRRCRVGAATPLSALVGARVRPRMEDFARCGRRARDAGGLYVKAIGRERERADAGWVYKVGRRVGTTGAGDPTGPFGTGRLLRSGQRVLWFWCVQAGRCQRTLEVRAERTAAAPGEALRVTVRGYDDQGAGVAVAGATVRLGSASATTGADGSALLTVPSEPGRGRLQASRQGMVDAFPREVRIG
jgi:hypothetical protein